MNETNNIICPKCKHPIDEHDADLGCKHDRCICVLDKGQVMYEVEIERLNAQLTMVKKFLEYLSRCSYPDAYVARNILEKLEGDK